MSEFAREDKKRLPDRMGAALILAGTLWSRRPDWSGISKPNGGQYITVLPMKDVVSVHQVDGDKDSRASVSPSSYIAMLSMIANSYCDRECK